ncbi:uncharacterized protein [Cardiocondyla obscurior]|uniref:uncharacterized protein n=1 Tax=Cardiocondyla obscurior TaxID=286306 RepID=UPI0039658AE9
MEQQGETLQEKSIEMRSNYSTLTVSSRPLTLLATSRALLVKPQVELYPVRLLMDQGFELSFIKEDIVQRAELNRKTASLPLQGIGGKFFGHTRGKVSISLQSIYDSEPSCTIEPYILSQLTASIPLFNLKKRLWPHIEGLNLADPDFSSSGPIDILVGADYFGKIIKPGLIIEDSNSPIAQQTIFGWILSGPFSTISTYQQNAHSHHCTEDNELQDILSKFWLQEEISPTITSSLTEDEQSCEQYYVTTHKRDSNGRYIVRLPLFTDPRNLGESRSRALSCLNRMILRFEKDPKLYKMYTEFLDEYKNLDHMTLADNINNDQSSYYLLHHEVLRESSITTKLRVVFNGSSRTSNGLSLNDIMYSGANHQRDIFDILLWIRTHRILFSTDVEKMFRQIALHQDDWSLQKILWKENDGRIKDYYLTTLTYGMNCAPFLALRTMHQLVLDEGHRFPLAISCITTGRYMDDIFGGPKTTTEAKNVIQDLIGLCNAGKFPLQKWNSNFPEVLPTTIKESSNLVETDNNLYKILGLGWKPKTDEFHFSVNKADKATYTKRSIASDIARIYDPLGLSAPVIITAKIILQEIWALKLGWDEPICTNLHQKWTLFRNDLIKLNHLAIPRWLKGIRQNVTIELHGYLDASQQAMAAAIYIKIVLNDRNINTQLVCAKTRVAPIKKMTIPRLELTAALMLTKLIVNVQKALNLNDINIHCWTDSSITLEWINSHPSKWKDFVRNRVAAIHDLLPTSKWHFVPSKQNPADCATRGITPDKLINNLLWWKGPAWLSESSNHWPTLSDPQNDEALLEMRPGNFMIASQATPPYWNLLDRFSSLTKLVRVVATCIRFINYNRTRPRSSLRLYPLTPKELEHSTKALIAIIQKAWFAKELRIISKGEQLPTSNALIRLTPFIDQEGLLRVRGRLHFASIDKEAKH